MSQRCLERRGVEFYHPVNRNIFDIKSDERYNYHSYHNKKIQKPVQFLLFKVTDTIPGIVNSYAWPVDEEGKYYRISTGQIIKRENIAVLEKKAKSLQKWYTQIPPGLRESPKSLTFLIKSMQDEGKDRGHSLSIIYKLMDLGIIFFINDENDLKLSINRRDLNKYVSLGGYQDRRELDIKHAIKHFKKIA